VKILLKDFQKPAVEDLVNALRGAARDAPKPLQAVSLSAATGSGKTMIATAAIETILEGDETHAAQPEATFLWVTDQPELNEQTRRKMLEASSVLTDDRLTVISATLDEELLKPGRVHFLNIQKLGKEKSLVSRGDDRTFTIWDTITNMLKRRPKSFFLIIDEAHRGMGESANARKDAATIIQKFIKGSPGELPPVPLVFGISATPERFNKLIEGTGRTLRSVVVSPEDVRASGLLKEVITLYYPEEEEPSDITMLRDAARSLKKVGKEWADYCKAQGEGLVRPILVVQVQDGDGKRVISKTDLAEAIKCIRAEIGEMPNEVFAHAFQEATRIEVDGQEVRYIAPPDIQGDPDVRVVFFKSSLNTGWDCPRAEVMMSFRRAQDATFIAQLVGRMVRTPLARRVDANERLNAVPLYLPHYDADSLKAVIDHLTKPDAETMPPTDIEKGQNVVTLDRAEGTDEIFEALSKLPAYTIPRARKSSEVRRLMKLARLLSNDELYAGAHDKAIKEVLGTLRSEYLRLKGTKHFKQVVEEKGKLEVRAVNWQIGSGEVDDGEVVHLDIAAENVDDLFEHAGRKLGEGLHKAWWRSRVEEEASATEKAKLELFALCINGDVLKAVENGARRLVQKWLKDHKAAISKLPEGDQQGYDEVRRLALDPELAPLNYPNSIEGRKSETTWKKHLYVGEGKAYPATLNSWETKVLKAELAKGSEIVAWLRNPPRKPWSLCVPYKDGGEWKPLYPDFLIVRRAGKDLVIDIVDPHALDLGDAPAKAAGLAEFAARHGHEFGRILLVIYEGAKMLTLDLADEAVRDRVKGAQTAIHLKQLYKNGVG